MTEQLHRGADALALVAEAMGVAIVAIGLLRALVRYLRDLLARATAFPREGVRLTLGRSLALALEFLLAADILRTAVDPSWEELGRLAAIAAIRTALNFFLQHEIAREERDLRESGRGEAEESG